MWLWGVVQTKDIVGGGLVYFCQRNQNVRWNVTIALLVQAILWLRDFKLFSDLPLSQVVVLTELPYPSVISYGVPPLSIGPLSVSYSLRCFRRTYSI